MSIVPAERVAGDGANGGEWNFVQGWNACRAAMLAAQPAPTSLPEWLTITREGEMYVVDVEGMATAHVGALTSCDPADLALYAIAEWLAPSTPAVQQP